MPNPKTIEEYQLTVPVLAYAEVHHRPKFFPSLIYKRWPEVVCDAPHRVDPRRPIPIVVLIKDANLYPVDLLSVVVHMVYESGRERVGRFPYGGVRITERLWWDSINVMPEEEGVVSIRVIVQVRKNGKKRAVVIDNYRGSTHSPLKVYVSPDPLPRTKGWYFGDIHTHSSFTSGQVEFGAPMEVLVLAAHCMGLEWFACTDHSYDLDDAVDNYMVSDPDLPKWKTMREMAKLLSSSVTVIPGEEITASNRNGRNCHLLALNSERYVKGSGDGGERGLNFATEHTIGDAAAICTEWGGFCFAAHPFEPFSFLEKRFLNRGVWSIEDIDQPGIIGMQFHNGLRDKGFKDGKKAWVRLLLMGRRIIAVAGSDSHGDMNRRRRWGVPMVSIVEDDVNTFASVRTAVRAKSEKSEDIIKALRGGKTMITEGPFIELTVTSNDKTARIGDSIYVSNSDIVARFGSSQEFGTIASGSVLAGFHGRNEEEVIAAVDTETNNGEYLREVRVTRDMSEATYVRAECETVTGKLCLTNPIWIEQRTGK